MYFLPWLHRVLWGSNEEKKQNPEGVLLFYE